MSDSEMAYEWFRDLIREEIDQEYGTIGNEKAWGNDGNIPSHEKYIDILKEAYESVTGEEYKD